jgi:hypothetical protein
MMQEKVTSTVHVRGIAPQFLVDDLKNVIAYFAKPKYLIPHSRLND